MAGEAPTPTGDRAAPSVLLGTKLYVRQPRGALVERERLRRALDASSARLILVSAPAGFGKTTLLAEWATHARFRTAWVSLDADDNNPATFLRYVAAALAKADPPLGRSALDLLDASTPAPPDLVVAALASDLAEASDDLVLVLDDYHAITSSAVHSAVSFLLSSLPERVRIAIATRADPTFPLSRLRARNDLIEVRAADLRFDEHEGQAFLHDVMGLDLTERESSVLVARTEGWIAGLQLAALSLRRQQAGGVARLVETFSGSHRYVLDFLVEEVLSREPEASHDFLLATSVLDRLSGGLCDAVTGGAAGQETLEDLERRNLFLVSLDDERRWYRYHHLFRDLLLARLRQSRPDLVPSLYSRAAAWCEEHGLSAEAMVYSLASGDYEQAASIAERWYLDMLQRSDLALAKIAEMPDEVLLRRPWLAAFRAVLDIVFARLGDAKRWLREAASLETTQDSADLAAFIRLERAYVADLDVGEPDTAEGDVVEAVADVLRLLPESRTAMRNVVTYWAAMSHYLRGDLVTANDTWERVVRGDVQTGATNAIGVTVDKLATIRSIQGRLEDAAKLCREWLSRMGNGGRWRYYLSGGVSANLADVLRERNELDEALRLVDQGLDDDRPWQNPLSWAFAYPIKSRILLSLRRGEEALALMRELDERLRGYTVQPDVRCDVAACWVRLHLEAEDITSAAARVDEILAGSSGSPSFRFERAWISRARVLLAQGQAVEALGLLRCLEDGARRGGRGGRLIEILCVESLALKRQGQMPAALTALEEAISLAEPEGYVRVFVDEGEPMLDLLSGLRSRSAGRPGASVGYLGRLIGAFSPGDDARSAAGPDVGVESGSTGRAARADRSSAPLVEPLSDRELEVLRLMAEGRSNQQIAAELIVATGTVKAHVHNICGKLGAQSRSHAVALARKLDLLT